MNDSKDDNKMRPLEMDNGQKVSALIEAYTVHANLLTNLTLHDLRIFGGYITVQVLSIGFVLSKNELTVSEMVGVGLPNILIFVVALTLLWKNYLRRIEASSSINNINIALGYTIKGHYLMGKKLVVRIDDEEDKDHSPPIRTWVTVYFSAVLVGAIAFIGLLFLKHHQKFVTAWLG